MPFALWLWMPLLLRGEVLITEFMTANTKTLLDEDGDASDWIEVSNPGPVPVALAGWFLTDDPQNLTKWRFAETNLSGNAQMVVFASAKNRTVAGTPLHANFKLASEGGVLALVRPDGKTIATQFTYPEQREDVSYGEGRVLRETSLVDEGAPIRVLIPSDAALGLAWTGALEPFDDAGWLAATNGVGFDRSTNSAPGLIAWWDFDDVADPRRAVDLSGHGHHATLGGGPVFTPDTGGRSGRAGDRALAFTGSGYAHVADAAGAMFDSAVQHDAITLSAWTYGADSLPQDTTLFYGSEAVDGSGNRSLDVHLPWSDSTVYWDTSGCCDPGLYRVSIAQPDSTRWKGQWNHYVFVKRGDRKEIWQNGTRILDELNIADLTPIKSFFIGSFAGAWGYQGVVDDFAIWDQALEAGAIAALAGGATPLAIDSLQSLIQADLEKAMRGRNASAYIRVPFLVLDPAQVDLLLLRAHFDDGLVCWINGVEVSRRNAPALLRFDSAANAERTNEEVRQIEEFDLSLFRNLLHNGTNILAIQGLNARADDTEFLVSVRLATGEAAGRQYFTRPTPGAPNGAGVAGIVNDVQVDRARGFYFEPMDVRLWTTTPGAKLVYTLNGDVPTVGGGITVDGTNALVPVASTQVLRAAAFKDGYQPSAVGTWSYLFPAAVADQTRPEGVGATWPGGYPADFAMDPRVIDNALPGYGLTNALLDIPSVNLVLPSRDFWDRASGIYANSVLEAEKAGSIEVLFPDASGDIQEDGGVSIRGFSSEYKSLTPKHSFTVVFRGKYGVTKLKSSLFGDGAANEFNGLVLRANALDSWANSEIDFNHLIDGELRWYRTRAGYVRDQWMRDTQLAQGQLASHGRFVHTYLNGLYWGLYNLDERIDEQFAAQYLGGKADEFDVVADSELRAGQSDAWNGLMSLAADGLSGAANYQRLMGNNPDGARNPAYPVLLDVTNLVDYMILHIYAGADDWPWHNWYAIRHRTAESTGFKFLAWDQELSINSLRKQHTDFGQRYADVDAANSPAFVYSRCRANAEFRLFFADRIQRHLFGNGALSIGQNTARYEARVAEIDRAIVAESARWGDYYRPTRPYLREAEWLGTNQWMRLYFFPSNHWIALKRFRDAGLFPTVLAPELSRAGGVVGTAFELSMSNSNAAGAMYYTVDGTDPRVPGGSVSATAQAYTAPLGLKPPVLVKARVLNGAQWSPLVEAQFTPAPDFSRLILTEIMYHPPSLGASDAEVFEFIELANGGRDPLDLSGLRFTSGIQFDFPAGTSLPPGQFLVLGRDRDAFASRYPGVPLAGVYAGRLSNAGDTITLVDAVGSTIFSMSYGDSAPWPSAADGGGQSLQRVEPFGDANVPGSWQASAPTPGTLTLLADSDADGLPDRWELANGTGLLVPDAEDDPDLDGVSNLLEYLQGTDPHDASDVLRLQANGVHANGESITVVLGFRGKAGRPYTIYQSDSLSAPNWQPVATLKPSKDGPMTLTNGLPRDADGRFFRLATP